jgi:hypothetical protein
MEWSIVGTEYEWREVTQDRERRETIIEETQEMIEEVLSKGIVSEDLEVEKEEGVIEMTEGRTIEGTLGIIETTVTTGEEQTTEVSEREPLGVSIVSKTVILPRTVPNPNRREILESL